MSTPTGTVQLNFKGQSLAQVPVQADGSFSSSYTTTTDDIGVDPIVAGYSGDASHTPSNGNASVEVDSAVQDTVVAVSASPNPVVAGQVIIISGTVSNA